MTVCVCVTAAKAQVCQRVCVRVLTPDVPIPPSQSNLVYSVPCTGTVRARTHCDILLLSKADTAQILQHFPESECVVSPLS